MLYEKLNITSPSGSYNFRNYYKNIYITNEKNAEGFIIINEDEKIDISDVDLIEDITGGVKSIQWSISTPDKLPITLIVSNVHLKPKELIFKTEQVLPVNLTNPVVNIETSQTLDVSVIDTASVSIEDATVTIDTALADLKTTWPGAQLDYNYVIFYSDSTLILNDLPYVTAIGPLNDKQILNTPDTLLIDANTFTNGQYVIFKYPLYRPTTDVLYSGNLDDLAPTSSDSNAAAAPPTDYYSTVIDLGTDIANLQNLYLIIYMSIYFTTSSVGGGDITAYFEGSDDQITWVELYSLRKYTGASSSISGNTGNVGILVSDKYRYYRFHYHVNVADGLSSYGYTYGLRKVLGW